MAAEQDEAFNRGFDNATSNSRSSSKKQKQKKVPQRGLGVAQLERIRLEEQQQKIDDVSNSTPFTSNHQSLDLSLHNSIIRHPQINDIRQSTVYKGWNSRDDDSSFPFPSNMNAPYESNPLWIQRAAQHEKFPSVGNGLSRNSSSLPVGNFQMEPPSNQIYCGSFAHHDALWPDEEKMVGMKRPYPFFMDNAQGHPPHSNPYKFPAILHPISSKSHESGNSFTYCFEPGNPNIREDSLCSTSFSERGSSKKYVDRNELLNGGNFLTLAPPSTNSSTCHSSNFMYTPSYFPSNKHKLPDFDSLPYQGNVDNPIGSLGLDGFHQLQRYHSFIPPAMAGNGKTCNVNGSSSSSSTSHGGEENLDLNLKL